MCSDVALAAVTCNNPPRERGGLDRRGGRIVDENERERCPVCKIKTGIQQDSCDVLWCLWESEGIWLNSCLNIKHGKVRELLG